MKTIKNKIENNSILTITIYFIGGFMKNIIFLLLILSLNIYSQGSNSKKSTFYECLSSVHNTAMQKYRAVIDNTKNALLEYPKPTKTEALVLFDQIKGTSVGLKLGSNLDELIALWGKPRTVENIYFTGDNFGGIQNNEIQLNYTHGFNFFYKNDSLTKISIKYEEYMIGEGISLYFGNNPAIGFNSSKNEIINVLGNPKVRTDKTDFSDANFIYTTTNYSTFLHFKGDTINKQTKLTQVTYQGPISLIDAVKNGYKDILPDILKRLPDSIKAKNTTAVLWPAIQSGNKEVISLLIKNGADITYVAPYSGSLLSLTIQNNLKDMFNHLLSISASVNSTNYDKTTPLMTCAIYNRNEFALKLITLKSKVNAVNDAGMSALLYAIQKGNFELVKIFVDNGADLRIKDKKGDGIIEYCLKYQKDNNQLLEYIKKCIQ
jgi:ankyrin repeat protein